jgi:hypothetical protein
MSVYFCSVLVLSKVGSGLASTDPPSKESYRLSVRFAISELILNGKRPEGLIPSTVLAHMICPGKISDIGILVHSWCSPALRKVVVSRSIMCRCVVEVIVKCCYGHMFTDIKPYDTCGR